MGRKLRENFKAAPFLLLTVLIFLVIISAGFLIEISRQFGHPLVVYFLISVILGLLLVVAKVRCGIVWFLSALLSLFRLDNKSQVENLSNCRAIIDTAPDPIVILDPLGNILSVNRATEKEIGYLNKELVGRHFSTLGIIAPATIPKALNEFSQLASGIVETVRSVYEIIRKDQTPIHFEINANRLEMDGVIKGVQVIVRNVDQQHRLVEELKELQARHQLKVTALESAYNGIAIVDKKGNFTWVNKAFTLLTGYEYNELIGKNPRILKSGLTDQAVYVDLWKTITAGQVWTGEITNRRKDGTFYLQELTIAPVMGENQNVSHYIAITQDITSRKKKEEDLQLFRTLIDQVNDNVFIVDAKNGNILDVNDRVCKVLGYDREKILGLHIHDIDPSAPDPQHWQEGRERIKKAGSTLVEGNQLKKDGADCPVEVFIKYTVVNKREYFVAIARDISEKRRLERQALQSQKMEAVGKLAGGVAHDFNNLLTAILGLSEISINALPNESPIRSDLEEIRQTTNRAARLTHQLLAFSRQQILEPTMTDINELVRNLEKMLHRLIEENIQISLQLCDSPAICMVDGGQIEQVIVNLVVNARDAMPNGGRLTIRTEETIPDAEFHRLHPEVTPGKYVRITVSDTGTGISPEIRSRVFEPFFTTKPQGKGTGLGLATCYGIVKQSHGYIYFDTKLGIGTELQVFLPLISEPAATNDQESRLAGPAPGMETLLLVEDDPVVRKLSVRVLKDHGYTVLEGVDGKEGLQIAKNDHNKRIQLMITDVVMPHMNGKQLAEELCQIRPDIKVLYTSGYTDESIFRQGVLDTGVAFLRKPFSTDSLIRKVRDVLDSPANGASKD